MIRRSIPVFFGLFLGICLLSFAYASYFESPPSADDAYYFDNDTSIMPLGYWGGGNYGSYYLYSGDNLAVRRTGSGEYTLYLGSTAFTGLSAGGGIPLGGGTVTTIPLASSTDSAWTSSNVNSVVSNVSNINNGIVTSNSNFRELISDLLHFQNLFFTGTPSSATGVIGGIYDKLDSSSQSVSSISTALTQPISSNLWYLDSSGETTSSSIYDVPTFHTLMLLLNYTNLTTAQGFANLKHYLVGTSGSSVATLWTFDDDLNKVETQVEFTNILEALASIQTSIQNPLQQIMAVLANDDDLELRQKTQPQVDAVTDRFLGEGSSAPTPDNIGDMADWSTSMGALFNSGVNAGQFFSSVTASDSYSFFSQEVANDLDSSGAPASISVDDDDDYLSDYILGDDGFYYLRDSLFFSIDSLID